MARALTRQGCEISFFLQLQQHGAGLVRGRNKLIRVLTGKHIIRERDPLIARRYPEQINAAARKKQVDAVLGTSSFYMVTQGCSVPSVFWGDTTVAGVVGKYPYYKNVTKRSIRDCHRLEQAALSSSTLAIFSSQWAADVACANYSFDERKLRVIPYGANLFTTPGPLEITELLHQRSEWECELLFVGLDWERKGAQIAIDITSVLRRRGVDAHLTLVGCLPPPGVILPEYVTLTGKIDKSTEHGQNQLASLYVRSHFLILPSRAECAAVSLAEASAYAVPSLSTKVGGNATLVKDGSNGHLFPLEAGPVDYAEYALRLLSDSREYYALCWRSFERFQAELNWDVAVSRLIKEIDDVRQNSGE